MAASVRAIVAIATTKDDVLSQWTNLCLPIGTALSLYIGSSKEHLAPEGYGPALFWGYIPFESGMCLAMLLRDRDPKYDDIASFACYFGYFMGSTPYRDQHLDHTLERCK